MSVPIEKSVWIDADRTIVFEYLVDGAKMGLWSGVSARLDPRPGGVYELDMGEAGVFTGRFIDVLPPEQVVYEIDPPPGFDSVPSRVEISLSSEAGGTRVRVVHSGLPDPFPTVAARGWDHHLARLSVVATGGDAGADSLCTGSLVERGWV